MLGGTFASVFGKWSYLVKDSYQDSKGRWSSIIIGMSYKQVTIIVSYRIPETCSDGVFIVKAQLDKSQKKIKIP